jgi:hypothetical protein
MGEEQKIGAEKTHQKQQQLPQYTISTNNNNKDHMLQDDTLEEYVRYEEPWSLDTAASGDYFGKITKMKNRKTTNHGIQVVVANNRSMTQIEEGELPSDRLPTAPTGAYKFLRPCKDHQ